jgi:hypothetical protein
MSEENRCKICKMLGLNETEKLSGVCFYCQEDTEDDFLEGKTCNPDAPEECESCQ